MGQACTSLVQGLTLGIHDVAGVADVRSAPLVFLKLLAEDDDVLFFFFLDLDVDPSELELWLGAGVVELATRRTNMACVATIRSPWSLQCSSSSKYDRARRKDGRGSCKVST